MLVALFPDQIAFEIEAEESEIAEIGVNAFTVGHRRLRGIAVLQVPRGLWRAAMDLALPQNLPGLPIDAIYRPAMLVFRYAAFAAEIKPLLRRFDLGGAD